MKVNELFDDRSKWTQKALARNSSGEVVSETSPEATCWCLASALRKCYSVGVSYLSVRNFVECNIMKLGLQEHGSIVKFNDSSTFEEVKALLEKLDV